MTNLAIIIPYYKLTFFRETLESLASQTDQRFHVYIGNDASPENPEELLKEFEGKFNFVYKKFDENLGGVSLTKHWARCIEMMENEEWFMILGDDDWLAADSVEGFYQTFDKRDSFVNVLRYNFKVINEKENRSSDDIIYLDNETSADFIVKRSKALVRSSLSEYVFKTKRYHKYGINDYPKAFYSDNMMVLRYSEFGVINNILIGKVFIRVSSLSITGNEETAKYLQESASLFYTDLLTTYRKEFTVNQKENFLPFMFNGYVTKKINLNFREVFTIILKNSNLKYTFHFYLFLVKHKIYKGLKTIYLFFLGL